MRRFLKKFPEGNARNSRLINCADVKKKYAREPSRPHAHNTHTWKRVVSSTRTKAIVKAVYYIITVISLIASWKRRDSGFNFTPNTGCFPRNTWPLYPKFEPRWSLVRMAIIGGDGDGGRARIAISPSFPNLLYRLFADLQMPAHFRILFQPCSSLGIISTAKFFFKSLL